MLDRIMDRWWAGASYFIMCGLAYVAAFLIVALPLAALAEMGVYRAGNWTYWLSALAIAPYLAGAKPFRRIMRTVGDEVAGEKVGTG